MINVFDSERLRERVRKIVSRTWCYKLDVDLLEYNTLNRSTCILILHNITHNVLYFIILLQLQLQLQ